MWPSASSSPAGHSTSSTGPAGRPDRGEPDRSYRHSQTAPTLKLSATASTIVAFTAPLTPGHQERVDPEADEQARQRRAERTRSVGLVHDQLARPRRQLVDDPGPRRALEECRRVAAPSGRSRRTPPRASGRPACGSRGSRARGRPRATAGSRHHDPGPLAARGRVPLDGVEDRHRSPRSSAACRRRAAPALAKATRLAVALRSRLARSSALRSRAHGHALTHRPLRPLRPAGARTAPRPPRSRRASRTPASSPPSRCPAA
jgi:hypothetical protein